MKVIVIAKSPFDVVTYTSVVSVSYANGVYTITRTGGNTVTYSESNYLVRIV